MSHWTSPGEPYPVMGYASQASGTAPMENTQAAQTGTVNSGRPVTPRSSFFQEGQPPPPAHTSDVFHRGSNASAPEYRAPEIGSLSTMESPTWTWGQGDHLLMVPPLRPVSRTGSHIIERDPHVAQLPPSQSNSLSPGSQHDPYDRPRSEPRRGEQISPPTLSTESSVPSGSIESISSI